MEIKVLGGGCSSCRRVEKIARQVIGEMGVPATITKVTDFGDIMSYDILSTPGLVIDEKLVCSGRVPSKAEVSTFITTALDKQE